MSEFWVGFGCGVMSGGVVAVLFLAYLVVTVPPKCRYQPPERGCM